MRKKRVAILGSTGSVGVNTLKVIDAFPDKFEVAALTAYSNGDLLRSQMMRYRPRFVAADAPVLGELGQVSGRRRVELAPADASGLATAASLPEVDIVVLALTGAAALDPFLAAVRAGKTVAPANKEALVMAGDIIMAMARKHRARVIPVDSEQSAIFQCLADQNHAAVSCLHLTASGGALRGVPAGQHDKLTVTEILAHPRWRMGAKITVDSATLMNKGFEVIEAMRLFDMPESRVRVVVHPEAVVHSLVEFVDGSWLAQLGITDMRLPIQYALTYPERRPTSLQRLDLAALHQLTFEPPDNVAFPSLELAFLAARRGRTWPAVLNAADEVAVEAFLKGRIRFTGIHRLVEKTVLAHRAVRSPGLQDIREADAWARSRVASYLKDMT